MCFKISGNFFFVIVSRGVRIWVSLVCMKVRTVLECGVFLLCFGGQVIRNGDLVFRVDI